MYLAVTTYKSEAIRIKVKKSEGMMAPEYRKFSVDPQITSFEVLQSLLARAFDIKGEFAISYLAFDDEGQETYLSLLSDWDLDAAFLSSSDPCLQLKADLKPFEEGLEDWDIITPVDFPRSKVHPNDKPSITGTILNHMERTLNLVQRALNIGDNEANSENLRPLKPPMSDSEFHNYLDSEGRLIKPNDLRLSVYQGGIEPSLRKVVWKHILNVYPEGLSGKERMSYMKRKSSEYDKLCKTWKAMMDNRTMTEEMQFVTNMVRKDVLRTDRTHKFYAGADDNKNVVSLFNILTTYALNHPSVSYCQGMSDLASPILVTMKDEAQAYVCFCALMGRLRPNFQLDGEAMTIKFAHLSELLQHYDPTFFEYLKQQAADDLLFCYRWLLLELKREFAFDDALLMLEVLWSSLPPTPPLEDLKLNETEFTGDRTAGPQSPLLHSRENPYTKVRAIRKQNSTSSIKGLVKIPHETGNDQSTKRHSTEIYVEENCDCSLRPEEEAGSSSDSVSTLQEFNSGTQMDSLTVERKNSLVDGDHSSADDSQEYPPMTTSIMRELRIDLENLNRHIPGAGNFYYQPHSSNSGRGVDPESPQGKNVGDIYDSCRKGHHLQSGEDDSRDVRSWTSDDHSTGDRIQRVGSSRKRRECPEFLNVNGSWKETESVQCYTPDEQCEIDFDEHNTVSKSSGGNGNSPSSVQKVGTTLTDSICNGEILEVEPDSSDGRNSCPCHLKSVIPIHLIRSPLGEERQRHVSSDSDASSSTSTNTSSSSGPYVTGTGNGYGGRNNQSEGYVSDATMSSKEVSMQLESSCRTTRSGNSSARFLDSGVAESTSAHQAGTTNSCEEALDYPLKVSRRSTIPSPHELGGGNPFMLFLCLTLLLQHRDIIVRSRMDYNELAMHFDKMVRKHHVQRVLNQSRAMYADYLQMGWQDGSWESTSNLPV